MDRNRGWRQPLCAAKLAVPLTPSQVFTGWSEHPACCPVEPVQEGSERARLSAVPPTSLPKEKQTAT